MKIEVNTNGATTQDFKFLDLIIDTETERRLNKVPKAKSFGVRTACIIDGEFRVVSDYILPQDLMKRIENA